jgi:hypothetical protein
LLNLELFAESGTVCWICNYLLNPVGYCLLKLEFFGESENCLLSPELFEDLELFAKSRTVCGILNYLLNPVLFAETGILS